MWNHGSCYNSSTWPCFLITLTSFLNTWPNFPNSRSSFWFSLKTSKAKWTTNWKTRLRVLKKILGRVFYQREFLKIWGAKITIYSLKYNLIVSNLRFRLASLASIPVKTIPWSTRAVSFQLVALVTYTNYLNSDLVIDIWKKEAEREKEREDLGWMKDFKVEIRDISSAKSLMFSLDLCRHVCKPFIDQILKISQCFPMTKILSPVFVSKQAGKTINTQPNNRLRFWSLQRKPKAEFSIWKA